MKIKKLSKETPQGSPFLYIVDENDEYIVATVLEKNKRSDPGIRKKGIILSMSKVMPFLGHRLINLRRT